MSYNPYQYFGIISKKLKLFAVNNVRKFN